MLFQVLEEPTRRGAMLDLFLTNMEGRAGGECEDQGQPGLQRLKQQKSILRYSGEQGVFPVSSLHWMEFPCSTQGIMGGKSNKKTSIGTLVIK